MPSVITSGEILKKVTPTPFTKPIAAPTSRATASAGSTISSRPLQRVYTRMAVSVTTEPTERAIPSLPLMMTSVCPAAMMPRKTDRRMIFVA